MRLAGLHVEHEPQGSITLDLPALFSPRSNASDRPTILLEAMLEQSIRPLATALAAMLNEAEAYGRATVDIWCLLPPKGEVHDRQREPVPRDLHASRELTVPAEQAEIDALAKSWHRELQRAVGVPKFEGDHDVAG